MKAGTPTDPHHLSQMLREAVCSGLPTWTGPRCEQVAWPEVFAAAQRARGGGAGEGLHPPTARQLKLWWKQLEKCQVSALL